MRRIRTVVLIGCAAALIGSLHCNAILDNFAFTQAPPDSGDQADAGSDARPADASGGDAPALDAPADALTGPAALSLSAPNVDFGLVAYQRASGDVSLSLTNTGGEATGPLQITIAGANASDFTQTNTCPNALGPGASCQISTHLTPAALGARVGTLMVTASPGGTPSAMLTGTGDYAYNDITDPTKWTTFDLTTVRAAAKGFWGGAFDGRYVYFVPTFTNTAGGIIARYDTQAVFASVSSWSTFDLTTVNAGAKSFIGAAFDGRYLYLSPAGSYSTVAARFDTQGTFTSASSWAALDVTTVSANATSFAGVVFANQSLFLVPALGNTGTLAEYDTTLPAFTNVGATWATYPMNTVNAAATGFAGAAFDGRYIYFAPNAGGGATSGLAVRLDVQSGFSTPSAYSIFDIGAVAAGAKGFAGAVFTGRYVYFVPVNNGVQDGVVARYDTSAGFTSAASWATFDVSTVNPGAKGFLGGIFDGRYVYLVPNHNTSTSAEDGILIRHDVGGDFASASSWSAFDLTTVDPNAKGFAGAAFDGRYIYLVPFSNTGTTATVARFDAKQPSAIPPTYHGSFF